MNRKRVLVKSGKDIGGKAEKTKQGYFAKYRWILCDLSLDTLPSIQGYFFEPNFGSPDKPGGEIPQTKRKVIHLHHEHTRTFSIGAVDSAIRDTFKL